jgi:hypothetical protein
MLSGQDTTPTVVEMLQTGVTPDAYGNPLAWDLLVEKPSKGDLRHTAWLLANIDKPKAQDFIARLAHREQWASAAFLDSLGISYFFVGSDYKCHTPLPAIPGLVAVFSVCVGWVAG